MRSIYKYDIAEVNGNIIEGPITKLLHVDVQHNGIKVWAEIDTNAPIRKFQILCIGTGWNLDGTGVDKQSILDTHTYLGTVMLANGNLVFHVYSAEIIPTPLKKSESPKKKTLKAEEVSNNKNNEAIISSTITMINPNVLKQFLGC